MFDRVATFSTETTLTESRHFRRLVANISDLEASAIYFCNVHMLMLSDKDPLLAKAMRTADIVFADGVPIAWLQRNITGRPAQVIRGYEMMLAIFDHASKSGEKVGFIGSTEKVMSGLVNNLCEQFPNLQVGYKFCPPYMKGEISSSPEEIQEIKDSKIKWLFVGLGCPKQEKWIARYKGEIDCHILGVGAAFDWLSGLVNKPPDWMEKHALAWLYRLFQEPRRMWKRYMIYNTKFILKAFPLLLNRK